MRNGTIGKILGGLAVGTVGTLSILSCGSNDPVGVTTNGGGATTTAGVISLNGGGVVTGVGGTTTTTTTPTTTANCGKQASNMTQQAADLLILLDVSGSMSRDIATSSNCNGGGCQQRWATVTSALSSVLSSPVASGIDWGLKFYASDDQCGVTDTMEVPVAAGTADTIKQMIAAKTPGSRTPTRKGIDAAVKYLKDVKNNHAKSILLATDGEPNCKGSNNNTNSDVAGTTQAIAAAAAAGYRVYVVGIGPETGNLDDFAAAGGTNKFFPATSPEALTSALQNIAGQVASCTFVMSAAPPDPNNLGVYLDKKIVPRDPANGWSLAPGNLSVVFNGSYCEGIKGGTYKAVEILFGCPGDEIPTVIP